MATKLPLVVCVDDDDTMLATLTRCLEHEPIELRATLSTSEAIGWLEAEEVAVLVTDFDMPGMTGAQLAGHALRVRPETVRILLTAKRALEAAADGITPGEIFRFLDRPFDDEILRQVVHAGIERNKELLAMSGDHERRKRRDVLRTALEAEYPGISHVARHPDEVHELPADPWTEAAALGLVGLTAELEPAT